ncbi:MAG: Fic family protein [Spirochaetia bacterium]|jgi:Fic family protein|nr:Fic family protein [Spirochaetia bacterium]
MDYISVVQASRLWKLSERSVRNYCATGRIPGAVMTGKTWNIPKTAIKPERSNRHKEAPKTLLKILKVEKKARIKGSIYQKIQIELTYNSNHMEGSRLTHDQTRYIYETNTVSADGSAMNVDDIIETANHFRCIDLIIDHAGDKLREKLILQLHATLKTGTSDSRKDWFSVDGYKRLPNEVGGRETTLPENVPVEINRLLTEYNSTQRKTLAELIDFHYKFETIHPFQDGNGRIGRLILFKECLRNGITPFIIDDDMKMYYYRGLHEWQHEKGYLTDTCLVAQDRFKEWLEYFRIAY